MITNDTYTLEFWTAYSRAGYKHVVFVGLGGTASIPARISRVTTRNVFVHMEGRRQPVHPRDIRPANPHSVTIMRRNNLLP